MSTRPRPFRKAKISKRNETLGGAGVDEFLDVTAETTGVSNCLCYADRHTAALVSIRWLADRGKSV